MKKQQKKNILFISIIFIFLISLSFVLSVPPLPHSFRGTALVGTSTNIASGTIVTARIGGAVKGRFVMTEAGFYGNISSNPPTHLPVSGSDTQDLTGETITFYIGCSESNTSTWSTGAITVLNLQTTAGYCGDGSCNNGESRGTGDVCTSSTNTCQSDCGVTAAATTTGGGGGTSGGGASGGEAVTTPTKITDTDAISDIISGIDASSLGMDSISSDDVTVTIVKDTITQTIDVSLDTIDSAINLATSDDAKQALEEIKQAIESGEASSLGVKKSLTVYKVKSKTTGKSTTVTMIETEFTASEDAINVRLIETVPKTMAESADEITFIDLQPTSILQADPIFEFKFAEVKEGDKKVIKYTINKQINEITSKTVASYETLEDITQPVCGNNKCEKGETFESCPEDCEEKKVEEIPWVGWTVAGIIIVIGLIGYFMYMKKKK